MRFWDSSALVPLLVGEAASAAVMSEVERDPELIVWWAAGVECVSALARLEREGALSAPAVVEAMGRLTALEGSWREVQPLERVRQVAVRMLRVHQLRAADALQLAAAYLAAEERPASLPLVTLDDRVARAAEREGFVVIEPRAA